MSADPQLLHPKAAPLIHPKAAEPKKAASAWWHAIACGAACRVGRYADVERAFLKKSTARMYQNQANVQATKTASEADLANKKARLSSTRSVDAPVHVRVA